MTDEEIEKMQQQISGEGDEEPDGESEEAPQQESAEIVRLQAVPQVKNEQLELDLLMKEKELEVLENITQVLKS